MSLRKVASVLVGLGLVIGLMGAGVGASFTDSATATANITSARFASPSARARGGVVSQREPHRHLHAAPTIQSSAAGRCPFIHRDERAARCPPPSRRSRRRLAAAPLSRPSTARRLTITLRHGASVTRYAAASRWAELVNGRSRHEPHGHVHDHRDAVGTEPRRAAMNLRKTAAVLAALGLTAGLVGAGVSAHRPTTRPLSERQRRHASLCRSVHPTPSAVSSRQRGAPSRSGPDIQTRRQVHLPGPVVTSTNTGSIPSFVHWTFATGGTIAANQWQPSGASWLRHRTQGGPCVRLTRLRRGASHTYGGSGSMASASRGRHSTTRISARRRR